MSESSCSVSRSPYSSRPCLASIRRGRCPGCIRREPLAGGRNEQAPVEAGLESPAYERLAGPRDLLLVSGHVGSRDVGTVLLGQLPTSGGLRLSQHLGDRDPIAAAAC